MHLKIRSIGGPAMSLCAGDKWNIFIFMEYDKVTRHLRKLAFAFETILAGLALINNNPG